jgi:hypothetical protein
MPGQAGPATEEEHMLRTNRSQLVQQSVIGEITSPMIGGFAYRIGQEGTPRVLPGTGGITYSHRIGDSAVELAGDHVEPGVSIRNLEGKPDLGSPTNMALNLLSCIGNRARVVSGEAKGETGYVTGTHGGINHVLIDFPSVVLDQLVIGDKIQVATIGVGMQLLDYPEVAVMGIAPDLFDKLDIEEDGDNLSVPVTHTIPAKLMGSGYGSAQSVSGDIDIQLFDDQEFEAHRLGELRFGDFVAIQDMAAEHGRVYLNGAITIGVIIHSRSTVAGHGPGVTMMMSSRDGRIRPRLDPDANLKRLLYG